MSTSEAAADLFIPALQALVTRRDLDPTLARPLFSQLIEGILDESQAAALLSGLRVKGESAGEIAALVLEVRARMIRLDLAGSSAIDTCGTGGDDSGTFNISTAAAFVVAGAGQTVVKHGNRAVSGKTGSADVLKTLGVPIEAGVEWAQRSLNQRKFAFCFAPHFHPALARWAPLRRRLGIRTIFNLIGPLANPAGAPYQLLGVGNPALLDPLAETVQLLGTERTILVAGSAGFDEVSLEGPTLVRIVEQNAIRSLVWSPEEFGLEPVRSSEIQASDAHESAKIIQSVLQGQPGPAQRIVIVNAAAALLAANSVKSLREGIAVAEESIRSGRALGVLKSMI